MVIYPLIAIWTFAHAATLEVPTEYHTIQAAIDAARDGDEVVVAPGRYHGTISFNGKAITVRSTNPSDPVVVGATMVDGNDGGTTVTFNHREGPRSVLRGVWVGGGLGTPDGRGATVGGGILCVGSAPTIESNWIAANDASGRGGGVYCSAASPTLRNNKIDRNHAGRGGGIACVNGAAPLIEGNAFLDNMARTHGGGIWCEGASKPTIRGNRFVENLALGNGGGIYCQSTSPPIEGNTLQENWAKNGAGICCAAGAAPVIRDNVLFEGWGSGDGSGVYCSASSPTLVNDTLYANTTARAGGGIACDLRSAPLIENVTLYGNKARFGAGIAVLGGSSPVVRNCLVCFNKAGGGVYVGTAATAAGEPAVSYSDAFGNEGGDYVGFAPGGPGNLSADPRFADAAAADFHLLSMAGRWTAGGWVTDRVHSPCIDAGDPHSGYRTEPAPNGSRVNMGADGHTPQASLSYLPADMLIRSAGETDYLGGGVRNPTGRDQTKAQSVGGGVTAAYDLRLRNEGRGAGTFLIRGGGGRAPWRVRYRDGLAHGRDITSAVTGAGWPTPSVPPGGTVDLRLEVTRPGPDEPPGTLPVTVLGFPEPAGALVGATSACADAVAAETTCTVAHRPDLMVRNAGAAQYVGGGVYNATGAGQTRSQVVASNARAVYQVRVRNAAALADELRLRGDAGGAGWSVRYFDRAEGGSDVTDQMARAEGRLTGVLQPGETQDLRVEVTPLGEQEVSRSRTVTLRATPRRGSPAMDAVRTVTTCPPAHRPDLMIRNPQDPEYLGQGIFNLTGAGQTKAQTRPPGATATFQFRVRNGALARDRCRIMGPAGAAQTRARYFEAASGGREITGPVTGWGWATPWLAPGETRDLRVEVSPLLGQARDVPVTLAIVAKSLAAPTVMDVVAASVTWSTAGGSSSARLSSLCAVPTPTGAAVTFSLSSPAQVDARILNLAGRPIRALCHGRTCRAGANALIWDGRAESGLRVPAGSYLVEIIARTPEGTQSRNVRAVVAGR